MIFTRGQKIFSPPNSLTMNLNLPHFLSSQWGKVQTLTENQGSQLVLFFGKRTMVALKRQLS
jgi:hypothetical protein